MISTNVFFSLKDGRERRVWGSKDTENDDLPDLNKWKAWIFIVTVSQSLQTLQLNWIGSVCLWSHDFLPVEGVAQRDEPTQNYHSTLQDPSAPQSFMVTFSSVKLAGKWLNANVSSYQICCFTVKYGLMSSPTVPLKRTKLCGNILWTWLTEVTASRQI